MLNGTSLAPEFNMDALAQLTDGFSGSDLKELCRNAAMVPVREFVRSTADNQEKLERGELEVSGRSIVWLRGQALSSEYEAGRVMRGR